MGDLVESVLSRARAQDRASIQKRLLARQFGRVPPTVRERIENASLHELDARLDAVLDAPTPESVFGDTPKH